MSADSPKNRRALVFPGQGTVGGEISGEVQEVIEDILGDGDVPYQLSVFASSVDLLHRLREADGADAAAVAGHSLGEYAAAYAAGSLGLEDGVRLVAERDRLMTEASHRNPGVMAALVRVGPAEVAEAVSEVPEERGVVVAANFNTPRQTVISGEPAAVEAVAGRVGGRKFDLDVAGAFHSPLMAEASAGMGSLLAEVKLKDPETPLVSGMDGEIVRDGAGVRRALSDQMLSPVRWVAVVERLAGLGVEEVVELGEGGTLVRMLRDFKGSPKAAGLKGRTAAEILA